MYHRYNLEAPDFDVRFGYWQATLRRWFLDYDSMSLDQRMVAVETIKIGGFQVKTATNEVSFRHEKCLPSSGFFLFCRWADKTKDL